MDITQTGFIFYAGCLFMALIYHFVLAIIQRSRLLLLYSAYLLACTVFLAERIWLTVADTFSTDTGQYWYTLLDEPIQQAIFFTYLRFVATALDIFSLTGKKFINLYKIVLVLIILYAGIHLIAVSFNWLDQKSVFAFITLRLILMTSAIYMLVVVSKNIRGLFFKLILAGSVILFIGNMVALITSLTNQNFLGIFGVMWTCIAIVLDVACFSAALGYKARRDAIEKQDALNQLLLKEKLLQQQELEKLNEIYKAREADRNRIARDLHDEIGSTLSSIHIYSSVAEKIMDTDAVKTKDILEQINNNTRMVMENMNDIVWAMKTGEQQPIILSTKIKNLGYELLNAKNIACSYDIDAQSDRVTLDVEQRRNILLVIKESLNNIVKYSEATEVIIKIKVADDNLNISIADNGKGFDINMQQKGNGLQNIQYRVNQAGGKITINSAKDSGTSINCSFPITRISDAS